jgi:hypothetical protein
MRGRRKRKRKKSCLRKRSIDMILAENDAKPVLPIRVAAQTRSIARARRSGGNVCKSA